MKTYKKEEINEVREDLLHGKIIAFPTDTVFGLACVYDDLNAIHKIYEAKGRDIAKSLPMMCSSFEMIEEVVHVSEDAKKLMKAFMPGAITIIYKKKDVIDDYVTSGKDTIAIRMPDDEWIKELINICAKPLLVTSANISNEGSLFKWEEVCEKLSDKIDGTVMEDARGDKASTIVDCSGEEARILRQGPISEEEINEVLRSDHEQTDLHNRT